MARGQGHHRTRSRRTSHEVRGLKSKDKVPTLPVHPSRTSHEVRGLKSQIDMNMLNNIKSHLTRGAWIEICDFRWICCVAFCRTSHEVYGRSFGVSMNQFRDLHLKSHLTIAFLFTYNNKKGREW